MPSNIDEDNLLRECHCGDIVEDEEKTFVYVEGTQNDKTFSEDDSDLRDTVWYNMKPPKLFFADYSPAVTARQVQIKRIQLQGKRKLAGEDETATKKEKINVSIQKKKVAVKYLSDTSLESMV
ncbi:uncharacterized protein LOC126747609 [Anthonomus grandis grandis]|uniref:uncharacterized protein LOC126747609 n=1 Tax=Anthonomus grandis grandis TaxID=2921223 RepID=UPI00216659B7|nr:uncharacterized protein LOC126747609 [Anthonomus grandis grandis]